MLSQGVTRRTRALTQMVWVLTTGVIVVVPVALLVDGLPRTNAQWHGAGLAALAGVIYVGAFYCLLRGLHVGDLGLVSALNALQGAYVAMAVILLGEAVTPLLGAALALCVVGAILTSIEGRAKTTKGAPWALASGFLFGGVMLCYAYAGGISWLSQSAISRGVSFLVALPLALLSGGFAVPKGLRARAVGAGMLELGGVALSRSPSPWGRRRWRASPRPNSARSRCCSATSCCTSAPSRSSGAALSAYFNILQILPVIAAKRSSTGLQHSYVFITLGR